MKQATDLDEVEPAQRVSFEVEFGEHETDAAAARHADVPETLGAVSVRQRIVGRHETARQTTQLAAASCSTHTHTHTHTQTRLTALFPRLPGCAGTRR